MAKQSTTLIDPLKTPIFLSFLPFSFIAFVLPIYGKAMGANAMAVGGLFSIVTASTLILRPFLGRALDRYGRKMFFLTALLLNTVAFIFFIFADTLFRLYLARFIQGFGFAFLTVSIITIVADLSSPPALGKNMGINLQKQSQGRIVGVFLGFSFFSFLQRGNAWQLAFLSFAVVTLIATWLSWRNIPETKPVAVPTETHISRKQLVPMQFVKLMIVVFLLGFALSMLMPISLIFIQAKLTSDVSIIALVFLPGAMSMSFLSSHLGKLADRFGRIPIMSLGFVFAGLFFFLVPLAPSMIALAIVFFLLFSGIAMVEPAQAAMVADMVGHESHGKSYGWYDFSRSLGLTTGPLLCGWLYDAIGPAIPFYFTGIVMLCGGSWAMLLIRSPKVQQKDSVNSTVTNKP